MSHELPGKSGEFYKPIADRVKTLEKLTALSKKEPTNQDLFEAVADTFATMMRINFEEGAAGIANDGKPKVGDGQLAFGHSFSTKWSSRLTINHYQANDGGLLSDQAWIHDAETGSTAFAFTRYCSNGRIKVSAYNDSSVVIFLNGNEKEEDLSYKIPPAQKQIIVESLIGGLNSRQPAVA